MWKQSVRKSFCSKGFLHVFGIKKNEDENLQILNMVRFQNNGQILTFSLISKWSYQFQLNDSYDAELEDT